MSMDLEAIIREAYKASGWSLKRLSDVSGMHYSGLYRFIVNERPITARSASMLCMALGLELRPVRRRKAR